MKRQRKSRRRKPVMHVGADGITRCYRVREEFEPGHRECGRIVYENLPGDFVAPGRLRLLGSAATLATTLLASASWAAGLSLFAAKEAIGGVIGRAVCVICGM